MVFCLSISWNVWVPVKCECTEGASKFSVLTHLSFGKLCSAASRPFQRCVRTDDLDAPSEGKCYLLTSQRSSPSLLMRGGSLYGVYRWCLQHVRKWCGGSLCCTSSFRKSTSLLRCSAALAAVTHIVCHHNTAAVAEPSQLKLRATISCSLASPARPYAPLRELQLLFLPAATLLIPGCH